MWYVEYLLLHRTLIRVTCDINSDDYNDLLLVEHEIEYLKFHNLLSPGERYVLDLVLDDKFYSIPSQQKRSIQKIFSAVCNRISNALGGIFTDEGYVEYMREKYNLSPMQTETLRRYISSEYNQKIVNKPFEEYS